MSRFQLGCFTLMRMPVHHIIRQNQLPSLPYYKSSPLPGPLPTLSRGVCNRGHVPNSIRLNETPDFRLQFFEGELMGL
jgi:hypothetical protein